MSRSDLAEILSETAMECLDQAAKRKQETTEKVGEFIAASKHGNCAEACYIVVGSCARGEAFAASDLDLIPIWTGPQAGFDAFTHRCEALRQEMRNELQLDVAKNDGIMRPASLEELADPSKIGGWEDSRVLLTQRVLLLTEGHQLAGTNTLDDIKSHVLDAYAKHEGTDARTAGGHPLAFINDVARYYRTVYLDYKAQTTGKPDEWAVRNVKLRHRTKFWYFATILPVASVATRIPIHHVNEFKAALLQALALPPIERLVDAVDDGSHRTAGEVLERYIWYLRWMANPQNRQSLRVVTYQQRLQPDPANPLPALLYNADLMHGAMMRLLSSLDIGARQRIMDWFLL